MLESSAIQSLNPLQRILALFRFTRPSTMLTSTKVVKNSSNGVHIVVYIYGYIKSKFAIKQTIRQSSQSTVHADISASSKNVKDDTRTVSNINYNRIIQPSAANVDQSGLVQCLNDKPLAGSTPPTVVIALVLAVLSALLMTYMRRRNRLAAQQNSKTKTAQTASDLKSAKDPMRLAANTSYSSSVVTDYDADVDNLIHMEQELEERLRNASVREINSSSKIKCLSGLFSFEPPIDALPLQLRQGDQYDRKLPYSIERVRRSSLTYSDSFDELDDLMFESSLAVNTARSIAASNDSGNNTCYSAELGFHVCFAADKGSDGMSVCTRKGVLRRVLHTRPPDSSRISTSRSATGIGSLHSAAVTYDLRVWGEDGKARRAWLHPEDLSCSRGGAVLLGPSENLPIELQEVAAAGLLNSRSITLKVAWRGALVLLCPSVRAREALLAQLTQDTKRSDDSHKDLKNDTFSDKSVTDNSPLYNTVFEAHKNDLDESDAFIQLMRASQFLEKTATEMRRENMKALSDLSESVRMHKTLAESLQQQVNALRLSGPAAVESGASADFIRERDWEVAELRRVLHEQVEANAALVAARQELLKGRVMPSKPASPGTYFHNGLEISQTTSPAVNDTTTFGQDVNGHKLGIHSPHAIANAEGRAFESCATVYPDPNSDSIEAASSMIQTLDASDSLVKEHQSAPPGEQPQVSESESESDSVCSVDDELTVASTILERLSLELRELQSLTDQQAPSPHHRALPTNTFTAPPSHVGSHDHQLVCRMPPQLQLHTQASSTTSQFGSQASKLSKLSKLSQPSGITNTSSRPVSIAGNSTITSQSAFRRKTDMLMRSSGPWTLDPPSTHTGGSAPFVVTKPRSNIKAVQTTHKVNKLSRMIKSVE